MSQRLRIIVILGKVNSSGDVCVNGDNTGSPEGNGDMGTSPHLFGAANPIQIRNDRRPKHSGLNFIPSIMI